MNVTGGAIITRAFKLAGMLGVSVTLGGDYEADGLKELQLLVQELHLLPESAYAELETTYQLAGQQTVTVGPGGLINIARPVRIERGTFARVGSIDYTVDVVERAEFADIELKPTGTTWPSVLWYDPASPLGVLHLWPKSNAELHLVTIPALAVFADVTSPLDLPEGYEGYLGALLAERIAPLYEVTLSDATQRLITRARRAVESNTATVPQLGMSARRVDPRAAFLAG